MTSSANRYQKLPPESLKHVGILTGGGDYSGLNAVNRSAILTHGAEGKFSTMVASKISGYCFDPNEISGRSRPPGT